MISIFSIFGIINVLSPFIIFTLENPYSSKLCFKNLYLVSSISIDITFSKLLQNIIVSPPAPPVASIIVQSFGFLYFVM